jgi:hypothetical protein
MVQANGVNCAGRSAEPNQQPNPTTAQTSNDAVGPWPRYDGSDADPSALRRGPPRYWSLSQVLVWMCTRDQKMVSAVRDPFDAESLGREYFRYRLLTIDKLECGLNSGTSIEEFMKIWPGGRIQTWGRRPTTSNFEAIEPQELGDLQLRIDVDEDGTRRAALWSKASQRRRWEQPRFSPRDVKRLWPAPVLRPRKSQALDRAILDFLCEITKSGPIIKNIAMAKSEVVPGWSRNSFERAWKELPKERKIARGKHGPRL